MIKNIYNLGDAALYCDFGNTVNKETNLKVINYFNDIRKKNITGIKNIAVGKYSLSNVASDCHVDTTIFLSVSIS